MSRLFRIIKIAPDANYARMTITAQWHEDSWYRDDYLTRPDPLRSDRRRDKLTRPSFPWAPYAVAPLAGDPMYPAGGWGFSVRADAAADGTYSDLSCAGRIPVNDFSTTVQAPFVQRQGTMSSGGALLGGGWTYCWCVCGVDSDGKLTAPSDICQTSAYAPGTFSATIPVLSWASGTVSWQLFGGYSSNSMTWQKSGSGTPSSITCGTFFDASWGCPDGEFDGLEIAIKRELHGGIWGSNVAIVGANTLTFPGCGAGGVNYAGRVVSLIGKADKSAVPIYNALVASNTVDILTLDGGSPSPQSAGIATGDIFLMRSRPTVSGLNILDPLWRNPMSNSGNGLISGAERGFYYRIIAGTGAGYRYYIEDNDATSHTIAGPWIVTPDSSSIGIIEEPTWLPESADMAQPNNSDPAATATLIVPCRNYLTTTIFLMGFTRDGGGNMPAEQICPFREIYVDQEVTAAAAKSEVTVTFAMSPYTPDGQSQFLHCDTTDGNVVIDMPAANTLPLDQYVIDKSTSDANVAWINAAAGEDFPEGHTITLYAQNGQEGGVYRFAPKH